MFRSASQMVSAALRTTLLQLLNQLRSVVGREGNRPLRIPDNAATEVHGNYDSRFLIVTN